MIYSMYMMHDQFGYGMDYGFGLFGGLVSLLWWIFVIWAVVMLVNWLMHEDRQSYQSNIHTHNHNQEQHLKSNPALDILKQRYAKGEVTKEEFEQIKKAIA